jgi:O-acetyl-ADP-ribose deacetylase (regulator of RNase III)
MPVEYVSGDLFANRVGAQALAHGCNCQGSMGAGIAVGFRERYPAMFEEYRRRCKVKPREFNPGDVFLYKAREGKPWVFNLATQEGYWRSRATYEAVEQALRRMRELADLEGITSVAMPRIGAGMGGLSWRRVRDLIERVLGDWTGTAYVYDTFVPEPQLPDSGGSPAAGSSERR